MRLEISILFVSLYIGSVIGFRCYICDPATNIGKCGDPFNETLSSVIDCSGDNHVCMKMVTRKASNLSSMAVGRTCSPHGSQACNKVRDQLGPMGNKLTFCKTCTTDLCNDVAHLVPASLTVVVIIALGSVFYFGGLF